MSDFGSLRALARASLLHKRIEFSSPWALRTVPLTLPAERGVPGMVCRNPGQRDRL
jgi:hypothetical protein